jgi:hypothetical protein
MNYGFSSFTIHNSSFIIQPLTELRGILGVDRNAFERDIRLWRILSHLRVAITGGFSRGS